MILFALDLERENHPHIEINSEYSTGMDRVVFSRVPRALERVTFDESGTMSTPIHCIHFYILRCTVDYYT